MQIFQFCYHIKWTQLANLPNPLCGAHVAMQRHNIYVTGNSPVENAEHQVYVYDINTDQWGQLPPSGHYLAIPINLNIQLRNHPASFFDPSTHWDKII